jgi:hypothetical protein
MQRHRAKYTLSLTPGDVFSVAGHNIVLAPDFVRRVYNVISIARGVEAYMLEQALAEFERISVGVETEGSFDGIEGYIGGVYEAHERVIELLEAGAPLCIGSQLLLYDLAVALEECKVQGLRVGAKKEVRAVLACAKRIHGNSPDAPGAEQQTAQGGTQGAEAQAVLDVLDRDTGTQAWAKKQAEADAMMEQLLAEEEEEKKAQVAKSAKSKRAKSKKGGKQHAASAGMGTMNGVLETSRDAELEDPPEDGSEAQPAVVLSSTSHLAVSEPAVPFVDAQAAASPVPADIRPASGRGRGGRGLGGSGDRGVQSTTATATGGNAVGAVAHLLNQTSLQVPPDAGATASATAAVPMALDMSSPPPAADIGATGRGRGRAPGSRGRGGRGLGGRGGVVASTVAHQLGQVSLQVPEGSSNAGFTAPVALAPPTAVTSLADAHFSTGRPEPPESTIGGQYTCIICFTNPKTHLAAPCGHQCACADCSAQMQECPVCRTRVQMWMQVRMA